jgi:hypothetical protein
MIPPISPPRRPVVPAVLACSLVLSLVGPLPVSAESTPDTENGRYSLQASGDGVIRLDTRTGAVSNCTNSPSGWTCYMAPDERKAMDEEIGRLQAENEKLKAQLASVAPGKTDEALPKSDRQEAPKEGSKEGSKDAPKSAESGRKIEIPLPSDQDMDRVISFLERAWQRLVEMANRMQKDAAGKI